MFGFLRNIKILYFLTLNIDKTEVSNMCVLYFNIIRIVSADNFYTPPINCKIVEMSFPNIFVCKPELLQSFYSKQWLKRDL